MNRWSPVTKGPKWYFWVNMVFTLGYQGSGIPVLKGFMVSQVIRICGLPLSKYISFTLSVNVAWLNIVDVVVSDPVLPVLGCLVVYF